VHVLLRLQVLLRLGGTEQRALYEEEWLPLSRPYILPGAVVVMVLWRGHIEY
jgi:hypothetical protein